MRQDARPKSGLGTRRGAEASPTNTPGPRDTTTRSLLWERTTMRVFRGRPASLVLDNPHIANFIDRSKALLTARYLVQWLARHPVPEIVPQDATSQGMRQGPS